MSDWELVEDKQDAQPKESDWEIVPVAPNSLQPQSESLGNAALKAPFRIAEDAYRGAYNTIKKIPDYYASAKEAAPIAYQNLKQDPKHFLGQITAGLAEQGQNVFNTPHDVANYAANRLNLLPRKWNDVIQKSRMPDTTPDINERFGEPKDLGDALVRELAKKSLDIVGIGGAAKTLNPMQLNASNIARDITRTERRMQNRYSDRYTNLFDRARNNGLDRVHYDNNLVRGNYDVISHWTPEKKHVSLDNFMQHGDLHHAQRAVSDLGYLVRELEQKTVLNGPERDVLNAARITRDHIQDRMFRNQNGTRNERLANNYRNIQNGYRTEVVPYTTNKAIQAFKRQELSAPELVSRVSKGKFMAQRGGSHRALIIRKALSPSGSKLAGVAGATYLGDKIYQSLMGEPVNPEK